jgi:hypothetical protein
MEKSGLYERNSQVEGGVRYVFQEGVLMCRARQFCRQLSVNVRKK